MGDRAVVGFRTHADAPTLYLYSHWGGATVLTDLAEALYAARDRWNIDPSYATRICVSHIIGDQWIRETGYGLSIDVHSVPDTEHVYVVDWAEQVLEIRPMVNPGAPVFMPLKDFVVFYAPKLARQDARFYVAGAR